MQNETHHIWGIVLLIILLITMGSAISIILILNQKKFHFKQKLVKVESDFQKNMLLTQLEIQEQTFQQISREIHDHIGQRLSLARLYINEYSAHSVSEQLEVINESSSLIEEAISDLKQLSRSLTANLIRDEGLLHALQLEINRINKVTLIEINLSQEGDMPFMSSENELIIFRIIQESLQNIIRHAEAQQVNIQFTQSTEQLSLIIKDDGKGFDPELPKSGKGAGLANMRNRAALLRGEMKIMTQPGQGTTLQFIFPQPTHISKDAHS